MASRNTLQVLENGYRNCVIKATQVSDGTDGEAVTIYNATSSGAFGVTAPGGQIVYPGIYSSIAALQFDTQDMKFALRWEASVDRDILVMGASPEDMDFKKWGGIVVPSGLAGATGSIKVVSLGPQVGASYSIIINIRKRVPQS